MVTPGNGGGLGPTALAWLLPGGLGASRRQLLLSCEAPASLFCWETQGRLWVLRPPSPGSGPATGQMSCQLLRHRIDGPGHQGPLATGGCSQPWPRSLLLLDMVTGESDGVGGQSCWEIGVD